MQLSLYPFWNYIFKKLVFKSNLTILYYGYYNI